MRFRYPFLTVTFMALLGSLTALAADTSITCPNTISVKYNNGVPVPNPDSMNGYSVVGARAGTINPSASALYFVDAQYNFPLKSASANHITCDYAAPYQGPNPDVPSLTIYSDNAAQNPAPLGGSWRCGPGNGQAYACTCLTGGIPGTGTYNEQCPFNWNSNQK